MAPENIDDGMQTALNDAPAKIDKLISTVLPQMFTPNGNLAIPAYIGTISWFESVLKPLFAWEKLSDNKSLPYQLARRLRAINAEIEQLVPDKEALAGQIKLIKEATAAAENLPLDLQGLTEAKNKVVGMVAECDENCRSINKYANDAFDSVKWTKAQGEESVKLARAQGEEAEKLVLKCEEAYRITTTKGLAAAFDQRERRLSWSMWIWVVGLLIALGMAVFLGASRVQTLAQAISGGSHDLGAIWMHLLLAFFSVGGPVWFAWLATKQIGQRFRLAEDYAFKASVAKAYEGYRREAARIDPTFEKRLFDSALSRLEEAPLRLVEAATHGSPWHELFESEVFQKAVQAFPGLGDKAMKLARHGINGANGKKKVPGPSHDSPVANP